jgi:hypothetical protein
VCLIDALSKQQQSEDNLMATKTKRERPDYWTNREALGNATAEAIHYSIMPLDKVAVDMELKWGCERLPQLVSTETALKFGSAKAKLDEAIQANDPQAVAKRADVLIKGWKVLNDEAEANGHKPLSPKIWPHTTDKGFQFAVAQGNPDAIKALKEDEALKGVVVYSLEELGRMLESERSLNALKLQLPGQPIKSVSVMTPARRAMYLVDDEIPF